MVTSSTTATTPARTTGTAIRVLFTFVGAAAMIVAAFMPWAGNRGGVDLGWRTFVSTAFNAPHTFLTSVGAVFIGLALVGLLGSAGASGWLTRVAGALGIVGFVLFAVEVYRAHTQLAMVPGGLHLGAWVALIGSVILLIAGFFGGPVVSVTQPGTPVG